MRKFSKYIQFIVLALFISCQNQDSLKLDEMDIPNLFTEAVLNQGNDLIYEILSDSIENSFSFYLYTEESIDSLNERINLSFGIERFAPDTWDYKYRNGLEIYLNHKNEILYEGKILRKKDSLITKSKEYIANPNYDTHLPEKKSDSVKYFGIYDISKQFIFVYGSFKRDSSENRTSWNDFIDLIKTLEESYFQLRNELSQKKWGKDFNKLEFDKQLSVRKIYPIRIYIFLDHEPIRIPPPEPAKFEEILNIIEDDEDRITEPNKS